MPTDNDHDQFRALIADGGAVPETYWTLGTWTTSASLSNSEASRALHQSFRDVVGMLDTKAHRLVTW